MKRRGFLGALAAVAAGGPKTIARAVPTDVGGLGLGTIAGLGHGLGEAYLDHAQPIDPGTTSWAATQLARLKAMTPWARRLKYRRTYVHALDPNTASLRSVSLGHKINMSKRIQFERQMENEHDYLKGIIGRMIDP